MKNYWVYMLQCKDGSYYIGVTNNLQVRLSQHQENNNPSSYVLSRRPVELVYTTHFDDINEAISWEKHIKKWSRRKKEALIQGDENALHIASACQNQTHYSNKHVMVSGDEPYMPPFLSPFVSAQGDKNET